MSYLTIEQLADKLNMDEIDAFNWIIEKEIEYLDLTTHFRVLNKNVDDVLMLENRYLDYFSLPVYEYEDEEYGQIHSIDYGAAGLSREKIVEGLRKIDFNEKQITLLKRMMEIYPEFVTDEEIVERSKTSYSEYKPKSYRSIIKSVSVQLMKHFEIKRIPKGRESDKPFYAGVFLENSEIDNSFKQRLVPIIYESLTILFQT
ncbi:hypothetical protein G7059_05165 [Erysipelothrix sp. HDW6A]|uniref:hypothetical protein n=1 Tax=Erysipelothrix sp. HDW6A TaxID=2714928 RepID=UPI00140CBC83|nr:hypothetical protein [Erysipelothrix sp. HDW6A]QIK57274.1 hypothetical protein G7059_05165 [Erysipelothrix sp. HDW6A]